MSDKLLEKNVNHHFNKMYFNGETNTATTESVR
jgi:hypothetical protein